LHDGVIGPIDHFGHLIKIERLDVLIHGLGNKFGRFRRFHRWLDLTKGCIALTNDEIEEIYKAVNDGVIIEINP
jgi:murein L,D-transpeptidase YafK